MEKNEHKLLPCVWRGCAYLCEEEVCCRLIMYVNMYELWLYIWWRIAYMWNKYTFVYRGFYHAWVHIYLCVVGVYIVWSIEV
jgi:hypothetical protein